MLAHVAYALPPLTRQERAANAKLAISRRFNNKQQVFLDFVLAHYVSEGVGELDQEKLTPLLRLKYHNSIADAVADLGKPEQIGKVFTGFQRFLYQAAATAAERNRPHKPREGTRQSSLRGARRAPRQSSACIRHFWIASLRSQ